jgi:hypothetical protein
MLDRFDMSDALKRFDEVLSADRRTPIETKATRK